MFKSSVLNATVVSFCALLLLGCRATRDSAPDDGRPGGALRSAQYSVHRADRLTLDAAPPDTLRMGRTYGDSLSFARVIRLYRYEGKLLGLDQLLSYHLSTVTLGDGRMQHFGRHGKGPREMQTPHSASFRRGASEVWVYDFDLNRFSMLDLSGDEPVFQGTAPGPDGFRLLDPVVGDQLVSNILSHEATLLIGPAGKRAGHRLIDLGLPFDSAAHPAIIARRLLNRSFMGSSPDGERFAIAYQFTPQLEIVSRTGEHLATGFGPREGRPSYRMQRDRFFWNDDNVSLYTGVAASDRHVYLLYCGCRFADAQDVRAVHVFDWQGRFLKEYAFDRPVMSIAVTADDSVIYGYTEEPHPLIAEWRLPGLLAAAY